MRQAPAALALFAAVWLAAGGALGSAGATIASSLRDAGAVTSECSAGFVDARLSSGEKCLRTGEFCSVGDAEYHAYGFDCPASGHLVRYTGSTSAATATNSAAPAAAASTTGARAPKGVTRVRASSIPLGRDVLLAPRRREAGCTLGPEPDRRCSPGAYYGGLTKAVICSPSFRTGPIRNVPESEKHQVEVEYGLAPKRYGSTLEIDHIVSLELGGSNDAANLFPEKATFADHDPGFHVKDKLENKLHVLVCSGAMSLRTAQRGIASNWEALYKRVFGVAPV